jgi:hypothetical protein
MLYVQLIQTEEQLLKAEHRTEELLKAVQQIRQAGNIHPAIQDLVHQQHLHITEVQIQRGVPQQQGKLHDLLKAEVHTQDLLVKLRVQPHGLQQEQRIQETAAIADHPRQQVRVM